MSVDLTGLLAREFLEKKVEALHPEQAPRSSVEAPLEEVIGLLRTDRIGSVLLFDTGGALTGIVTERDVINRFALVPNADPASPARTIMTSNPETVNVRASIARVLSMMSFGRHRHIPVVPASGGPYRVITVMNVVNRLCDRIAKKILDPDFELPEQRTRLDQLLQGAVELLKPDPPLRVTPHETVTRALQLMRDRHKGCVVIVDAREHPIGIFTERDYLTKVYPSRPGAGARPVEDYMTRSPKTILRSTSIAFALSALSGGGFRHLPLVDDDERYVGTLSVRNIIDAFSNRIIETLEGAKPAGR